MVNDIVKKLEKSNQDKRNLIFSIKVINFVFIKIL